MGKVRQIYQYGYKGRRAPPPMSERQLAAHLAMIPEDTRDLTGRAFGDPIPGDRRRTWRRKWETANSVEG